MKTAQTFFPTLADEKRDKGILHLAKQGFVIFLMKK